MKYLITAVTILIWICVIAGMNVSADPSGTVTATVTAAIYSVVVQDASIAYGTVALAATDDTTSGGEDDQQHAGNNGSTSEKINIQGTDSSAWEMVSTVPTGEQYRHRFATQASDFEWFALDEDSYQTLNASLANGSTQDFHLEVMMSDDTAATSQQDVNVTIQAVAP